MMQKATSLNEALGVLRPYPLIAPVELATFYSSAPNTIRGGDKIIRIKLGLESANDDNPYKVFLIGHPGTGKSTEISRLIEETKQNYRYIRFDITRELDPVNFKPFDVLLLMMIKLVEQTALPIEEEGAGYQPSDDLLENIYNWYHSKTVTITRKKAGAVTGEASIGTPKSTWWSQIVTLFASIKGELKFSADREEKVVNYRLSRINELIDIMNALLEECNHRLNHSIQCSWVFVGESFDKKGIPPAKVEELFITYGNILQELNTHLIFNIPLSLVYCEKGRNLPALTEIVALPDTPVFNADHTPHIGGRKALTDVLNKRMLERLLASGQQDRLIVASGGNIRNLFRLAYEATMNSLIRSSQIIEKEDVDSAITKEKRYYEGILGSDPSDEVPLTWEEKAQKLLDIYNQDPNTRIRDAKLNALLRAQAVLEFNGAGWFGVHPVVVDILHEQGRIQRDSTTGVLPGGTE